MTRRPSGAARLGPILAVVVLDQVSKVWAVAALSDRSISIVGSVVQLRLARNPGGAFSLLPGSTPLLSVLALGVVGLVARAWWRTSDRVPVLALGLVLGGAMGNLADRLFREPGVLSGAVIDFVKVGWWPTFNVADSAITIGVAVIVGRGLIGRGTSS
ncbi:MAG: signal peptidase II [Acidimicrobiia bacterium]